MPESTRNLLMLLGLACFSGGVLLMIYHRRQWMQSLQRERHPAARIFETRKFRRRVILAGMIGGCGAALSSLYWAREPRVLAAITGLILILLLFILWLALRDALIVGFYKLGQSDTNAQRELRRRYEEYKRRREQAASDSSSTPPQPPANNDEPNRQSDP